MRASRGAFSALSGISSGTMPSRWTLPACAGAEGAIGFGLGRIDQAEASFQEVRKEFQDLGKVYDAALVSLDLAALSAQQGRTAELKWLAAEMVPIFESREIHREGLVAL